MGEKMKEEEKIKREQLMKKMKDGEKGTNRVRDNEWHKERRGVIKKILLRGKKERKKGKILRGKEWDKEGARRWETMEEKKINAIGRNEIQKTGKRAKGWVRERERERERGKERKFRENVNRISEKKVNEKRVKETKRKREIKKKRKRKREREGER